MNTIVHNLQDVDTPNDFWPKSKNICEGDFRLGTTVTKGSLGGAVVIPREELQSTNRRFFDDKDSDDRGRETTYLFISSINRNRKEGSYNAVWR